MTVDMFVCVYVCVRICIHTHIHTYIHTGSARRGTCTPSIHSNARVPTYTHICVHIYIHIHTCRLSETWNVHASNTQQHKNTYIHTCMCLYIQTHIHIYMKSLTTTTKTRPNFVNKLVNQLYTDNQQIIYNYFYTASCSTAKQASLAL
jgi:hypothetical protein